MKKVFLALSMLAIVLPIQQLRAQDLDDILNQMATAQKATYKPVYKFDTYLQMEISEAGDQTMLYDAYVMKDGGSYAVQFLMDGTRSLVLLDMENNALLMLGEEGGMKTGVAMGFDPQALEGMTSEFQEPGETYSEFKTGKTL